MAPDRMHSYMDYWMHNTSRRYGPLSPVPIVCHSYVAAMVSFFHLTCCPLMFDDIVCSMSTEREEKRKEWNIDRLLLFFVLSMTLYE